MLKSINLFGYGVELALGNNSSLGNFVSLAIGAADSGADSFCHSGKPVLLGHVSPPLDTRHILYHNEDWANVLRQIRGLAYQSGGVHWQEISSKAYSEAMERFEENASGREASFRVGEVFEIYLSETRTAGFKWMIEKGGDPVIALARESTEAAPGPAGGAGMHIWQFHAVRVGTATILLRHGRTWESADVPGRMFQLQVRVTE